MKRVLIVLALLATGCGGGSSSPAAPSTTPTTTAAFSVTGISPSAPTVSALPQTLTITGTGFQSGLSMTMTPPTPPSTAVLSFSGSQILNLTPTSFQVSVEISLLSAYTFQVTSAAGEKSGVMSFTPQYRTTGTTWIPEGVRVRDSDLNSPIADVGVIRLSDGRWRMFIPTRTGEIRSAISPDGLAFSVESGVRYFSGFGPRVLRLDDGRMRMFYNGGPTPGFSSAISSDEGLTWTNEGLRLSAAAAGETGIITPGIVRVGGVWKAYFSDVNGGFPATHTIHSATSFDMLNWTVDPGQRLGPSAALAGGIHPTAFVNDDGSISLFYGREGSAVEGAFFMWTSRSTDGLTFTTEAKIESLGKANDPEIVRVGSALRMYYDWGDTNSGVIYSALSASGAPSIRRR